MRKQTGLIAIIILTLIHPLFAQEVRNVDSALIQAQNLSYLHKYDSSIALCKKILVQSPNYADVTVLLGRVYCYNGHTDSALQQLEPLVEKKPYEDAYIALCDIERWANKYDSSLYYAQEGLINYPNSQDLMIRKARALYALQRNKEAYNLLDSLLKINEKNDEARQLAETIKVNLYENIISLSYSHDHFTTEFNDDWYLATFSYTRLTKLFGSVVFTVNWADRFVEPGKQYEIDMYPSIGNKMYLYLDAAYSASSIFPQYSAEACLYRNLPESFEASIGYWMLYFGSPTVLYTGSIGKYYKNFWFSFSPIVIAYNNASRFSDSYSFTTRYYTKSANDYYSLTLGYGISPDNNSQETLYQYPYSNLFSIKLGFQTSYKYKNIFFGYIGLTNEGYYVGESGTLFSGDDDYFEIGYQRYF
jgi:YaiO family outer membrane protein